MTRRWSLAAAVIGVSLSVMAGSGLIAFLSDSVVSQENSAHSGTFAKPAHDLRAMQTTSGDCSAVEDSEYQDEPLQAVFDSSMVLFQPPTEVAGQQVCIKNFGTEAGQLMIAFTNVIEREMGACEASEIEAGDVSCEAGDRGELAATLGVGSHLSYPDGPSLSHGTSFSAMESSLPAVQLDAGGVVKLTLTLGVQSQATEEDKLRAQTDRITWDIALTLQDIT